MTCFVILHYLVKEETIHCVDSILILTGEKYIIIVDNASPDQSGIFLKEYYKNNPEITVILNEKNEGFAIANNRGYQLAREMEPDFIIVMNNDMEIVQTDFLSVLYECYNAKPFYVAGPDVYCPLDNIHQNPKRLSLLTYDEIKRIYLEYQKKCKSRLAVPVRCLFKNVRILKRFAIRRKFSRKRIDYEKHYENIILHGSCVIFASPFIRTRSEAFYPGTFFYYETEILSYLCQKEHMNTIYLPELKVIHYHSVATKKAFGTELKQTRFANECIYNSLKAFLALWNQENSG